MTSEIKTISTPFIFRIFNISVNCYLVKTGNHCILIDTGLHNKRNIIEKEIERAGCWPGKLKLIILTHGDFDHTGNAAYFRKKFGAKIAMHYNDSGMVENGNMFWNRKKGNNLIKMIAPVIFGFGKQERFKPDFTVDEGYDFSEYGFNAKVISIPGHSKGSIGILTTDGDLFCGDLLANINKPDLWLIVDDKAAMNASAKKLKSLKINMVYPGHGKPFQMELFLKNQR